MVKNYVWLAFIMFSLGIWTSCQSAPKPAPPALTESEVRTANCAAGLQMLHQHSLGLRMQECMAYGVKYICVMGDPECPQDLVAYCRIRAFRALQYQIQQCEDAEDFDLFMRSIPSDRIITPDGKTI